MGRRPIANQAKSSDVTPTKWLSFVLASVTAASATHLRSARRYAARFFGNIDPPAEIDVLDDLLEAGLASRATPQVVVAGRDLGIETSPRHAQLAPRQDTSFF